MRTTPIRVLLVDDHAVLRVGLRAFLEERQSPRFVVLGEAARGEDALELIQKLRPDVVLLDLSLEGMGGLETTIELRRRELRTKVLVLTQHAESIYLKRLLEAGANGYLLKSARGEQLVGAIEAVVDGGTYVDPTLAAALLDGASGRVEPQSDEEALARLTPRERQVLVLVAEGSTNKEIAKTLDVAVKTVMTHRANMMEKLGIHNRSKLVQFAIRTGLLTT